MPCRGSSTVHGFFMALLLVSHPLCPFVHRATSLLAEYGVSHERRFVDLDAKPAWFVALSPRGKVPVLVVDGVPIFESNVILEYLAERFAPQLLAGDPLARARRRMWMEVASDLLASQYKIAVASTQRERETAIAATREMLARFESLLGEAPFVGGERPGLVDFATGPALVRFEKLNADLGIDLYAGLPKVVAWSRTISARPAFTSTLVHDFDAQFHALVKHDLAA